jgi:hypothetical protein
MKSDQLITQIEMYSNAIVGFAVLQAIAFSYSFGTNEFFNCLIKTSRYLPHGIAAHFLVGTILTCYAMIALRRLLRRLSKDNSQAVGRIYLAKCVIVIFFTSMPLLITINYGMRADAGKAECKQSKRVGDADPGSPYARRTGPPPP